MYRLSKILFTVVFIFLCIQSSFSKTTLSGKITDKSTGEALPGVALYISDLKTGAISDINGNYKIENLPQSKVTLQVSFVGYKTIVEKIDLSTVTVKDFVLEESITEIHEVVVTGLSAAGEKKRTATPIATIPQKQLLQTSSTNIIDALATQPGVSQVTTGAAISKPVIRGLGYNRVVVVNDNIRQEGQQWGDEHGIEVDEFSVDKVEILKGPASLSYGSDAMAGVVNLIPAPTLPEGNISGKMLLNYQTNNGLICYSGDVKGNQHGFIWDMRYSNKQAHAYSNKYDGFVLNSGFRETNFGGELGLNKSWGYSHFEYSIYNMSPGIVEGERDSASGKFIKGIAHSSTEIGTAIASPSELKSYDVITPYQRINHYKAILNNNFILGNGSLKSTFGFQQNQRQEYADVLNPNEYGLYMQLNTINYDVRYLLPEFQDYSISFGVNGMQQSSENLGHEFLIPDYHLFDAGIFSIIKKSLGKLDLSGGVRLDTRIEKTQSLFVNRLNEKTNSSNIGAVQKFEKLTKDFSGFSGSAGATYQFSEQVYSKINFSRGFRAPNIGELSANGVHDGTLRYEIGNPNLKPENSFQVDYAMGLTSPHISTEIDLFSNTIDHFIYSHKLQSVNGTDSLNQGLSSYKFFAAQANLSGGEISIDIHPHPLDWLHFENAFSYVKSIQKNQSDSTKYLPFTPAPKISSELKANSKKIFKYLNNAYIKTGVDYYFEQKNIYSAYSTETKTPAYLLVNIGLGSDVMIKSKTVFSFFFAINNLTDVAYQSHLSRLKYDAYNFSNGRTGVFDMGRNFSVKILVPISFQKNDVAQGVGIREIN